MSKPKAKYRISHQQIAELHELENIGIELYKRMMQELRRQQKEIQHAGWLYHRQQEELKFVGLAITAIREQLEETRAMV